MNVRYQLSLKVASIKSMLIHVLIVALVLQHALLKLSILPNNFRLG
ncbi:hypothetical protein HMPREF1990_01101 [Porphyromonas gingivalis W4087]|uniref:Uncharacterized protein n=1 Tax=Porphyromonas gingivalis F0570 TaxID=1227271 RepID=A0A0E2LSY1_PORGN|nr:hypothetical protein HMPREF1554_01099 [Porphyromonas gingivalis F0569]ERJ68668.1 hypothetical protein HMPREF1555_00245 [Porphyromonas gingivalis F0570]ERJ86198.1 hypothetical protein HMPREF1988_00129 [Porphyromonas gingivalis F0185]ERJ88110.1 hypothetical protein HMPREF1989_00440 [Porphyromonas gingivalis F0566]ERJ88908.1 hypothetical protein HMPREF1990_01101 [Porphyromonas gingivalis W4087]